MSRISHSSTRRPLITPTLVFMPQEEASSTRGIHVVELFQCPECESVFEAMDSLRHHLRTHSTRKGPYGCLYCGMIFSCPPCLQDHLQSHVRERLYRYRHQCCREVAFTCVDTLRDHIELHTEGKCRCCGTHLTATPATSEIAFPSQRLPTAVRPPSEGPLACEQCGKTYDTPRHLKKHVYQVHTHPSSKYAPERPFPCLYCRKSFVRLSGLQMHTYNYHNAEALTWCAFCERVFVQDSHCQLHAQAAHSGDKPYQCRVCGEAFQESTSLQLHRSSHADHSFDRVFKCGYCDKELGERQSFWMHLNFRHFEEAFVPQGLPSSSTQSGKHSQMTTNEQYTTKDTIVIPDHPPPFVAGQSGAAEQPLLSARSSRSPCTDVDMDVDTPEVRVQLSPSPEPSLLGSGQAYRAGPPNLQVHSSQSPEVTLHTLQSLLRLLQQSSRLGHEGGALAQANTCDSLTAADFQENALPLSQPWSQGSGAGPLYPSSLSPPHQQDGETTPVSYSPFQPQDSQATPVFQTSLSPQLRDSQATPVFRISHSRDSETTPVFQTSLSPQPLSRSSPAPPDRSSVITSQDGLTLDELCQLCAQPSRNLPDAPVPDTPVPNGREADSSPPTLRINWDAPLSSIQTQAFMYQQQQRFHGISR